MSPEPKYQPTPQQIADECALIRAEWSEAERLRRLRYDWRHDVAPTPLVRWPDLQDNIAEED